MTDNIGKNFGRVAVLMGGTSAEREVSLVTGKNIYDALIRKGVDAFTIDVGPNISKYLENTHIDNAFIALHGKGGEDGAIQGLCELLEIPYTGSGVMASAITLNKAVTKYVWKCNDIPTPDFVVVDDQTNFEAVVERLGLPLCVKPVSEGSSVGISRVDEIKDLPAAIEYASQFNGGVMIEPWIIGKELTVGILNDDALPVIEIITKRDFYDYKAKYEVDDNEYRCPCSLDEELEQYVRDISLKAFKVVGCKDWGRVDLLLDENNDIWILDLNTIPGMTEHSLIPKSALVLGLSFDDVVLKVLEGSAKH